jgi:hypothetical protein
LQDCIQRVWSLGLRIFQHDEDLQNSEFKFIFKKLLNNFFKSKYSSILQPLLRQCRDTDLSTGTGLLVFKTSENSPRFISQKAQGCQMIGSS